MYVLTVCCYTAPKSMFLFPNMLFSKYVQCYLCTDNTSTTLTESWKSLCSQSLSNLKLTVWSVACWQQSSSSAPGKATTGNDWQAAFLGPEVDSANTVPCLTKLAEARADNELGLFALSVMHSGGITGDNPWLFVH